MTNKQVRSLKRRLGKQFDRIAKAVTKMKGLPAPRRMKAQKDLAKELKKEERSIIRIQKRCARLAKAA